jgi:hypothetical protein
MRESIPEEHDSKEGTATKPDCGRIESLCIIEKVTSQALRNMEECCDDRKSNRQKTSSFEIAVGIDICREEKSVKLSLFSSSLNSRSAAWLFV